MSRRGGSAWRSFANAFHAANGPTACFVRSAGAAAVEVIGEIGWTGTTEVATATVGGGRTVPSGLIAAIVGIVAIEAGVVAGVTITSPHDS